MADRRTKERKLVTLMVGDLNTSSEPEMVEMEEEVRSLPDEELDKTLAFRLGLSYPVDAVALDRALMQVEGSERLSEEGPGGLTGAPDMSHQPRPGERLN